MDPKVAIFRCMVKTHTPYIPSPQTMIDTSHNPNSNTLNTMNHHLNTIQNDSLPDYYNSYENYQQPYPQ